MPERPGSIEDHEIGRALLEQQIRLVAARNRVDAVPLRLEVVAQEQNQRLLVLHDQDIGLHALSPSSFPVDA
jgi:hypothetical protein